MPDDSDGEPADLSAWVGRLFLPGACMNWFRWSTPRRSRPKARVRLAPELLEDRTTPTLFTWSGLGPDSLWSDGANWRGGAPPAPAFSGDLVDLDFPAGAAQSNTTNDLLGTAFDNITFDAGGYSIGGQALSIANRIAANNPANSNDTIAVPVSSGSPTIGVANAGASLSLTQALSDPRGGPLTKSGSGTLLLSGDNSGFTGLSDIQAGVLQAGSASALAGQGVQVSAGAALWLQAGLTFAAVPLALQGDGIVVGGTPTGALRAVGASSTMTSYPGTLTLASNTTIGVDAGSTLLLSGSNASNLQNFGITKQLPGVLEIGGNGTHVDFTVSQGTLQEDSTLVGTGNIVLAGGTLSGGGVSNSIGAVGSIAAPAGGAAVGTISPGDSGGNPFGLLTASGNVALGPRTTFGVDLSHGSNHGPGFDSDQLIATGSVSIGGALLTGTTGAGVQLGDTFIILTAIGPITGQFSQMNAVGTLTALGEGSLASLGGATYTVHYDTNSVTLTRASPPDGPNGTIGTAIPLGTAGGAPLVIQQAIVHGTDVDFFAFNVAAGADLSFGVDKAPGAGLDSFVRLLDANGNQLVYNDDGFEPGKIFNRDSFFTYHFAQAGTYYLGSSGYPNYHYNPVTGTDLVNGTTGAYTLTISRAVPVFDPNEQIRDAKSLGAATQIRQVRNFSISDPSDVDMFSFTVRAGQRITIAITRPDGRLASQLRLFNAKGQQLAKSGGGQDAVLTYTFRTRGTYYIGVSGRGNASYSAITGNGDRAGSVGDYTITLAPGSFSDLLSAQAKTRSAVGGLVYYDQNSDGKREAREPGESSHMIFIDVNRDGIREDGEIAVLSNSRGIYQIPGLAPGKYYAFALPAFQGATAIEKTPGDVRVTITARKRLFTQNFGMTRYLA
jgi:autotransporter-associated beta strand protein